MAQETYANARARIHTALRKDYGWRTSDAGLKRLWADTPQGDRVWFRAQAVYLNDHSLFLDFRGIAVEAFIKAVYEVRDIRRDG